MTAEYVDCLKLQLKNVVKIERDSTTNLLYQPFGVHLIFIFMRPRTLHSAQPIASSRRSNKRVEVSNLTKHIVQKAVLFLAPPKERDFFNEKGEHCIRII